MTLANIEAFLEIVNTRNITKASENLHLSQTTVSHRLKLLEQEVGAPLIIRHKGHRTIQLTRLGEEFVALAERWVMLYRETAMLRQNPSVSLTVGAVDSLNTGVLYQVYQHLSDGAVPVNLQIRTHQSTELYNFLENREIDIGFVSFISSRQNVRVEHAFSQRMQLVRSVDCPECDVVHPHDLDPKDELFMEWGPEFIKWHNRWWDQQIHPHVVLDSVTMLQRFIENPRFWALVPESSAQILLRWGNVRVQSLSVPVPERKCYRIVHRYPRPSSLAGIQLFEQLLTVYLAGAQLLQQEVVLSE